MKFAQAQHMAKSWADEIADWLPRQCIDPPKVTVSESGNVSDGYIISVEFENGNNLHIEIVAGPLDD